MSEANAHLDRLSQEQRKAKLKAFFLNWAIWIYSFYLIGSLAHFYFHRNIFGWWIVPVSFLIAIFYSASRQSLGYLFMRQSNRILKHHDKLAGSSKVRKFSKIYF